MASFASSILGGSNQPRGLHNFIAEIRNCTSKEEERIRVDKELANIRSHFSQSGLSSYQKKKYVWKMCYIYMLGYEIDFGHVEFISLLSSSKFQEKSVGYLAVSLLIKSGDSMMTLIMNSMRNDLLSNNLAGITLALAAIGNIGGVELADSLSEDIEHVILNPFEHRGDVQLNNPLIVKKACMCLLQMYRANPDCVDIESWPKKFFGRFSAETDLGVLLSSMNLLVGFTSIRPDLFQPLVPTVVSLLNRLVVEKDCSSDYLYYRIPSPWLQVKCIHFLQYFELPTDPKVFGTLKEILDRIIKDLDEVVENVSVNKSNAENCVLFEAINLLISYGPDAPADIKANASSHLGSFIAGKDANVRYLALESLSRVVRLDGSEAVEAHMQIIMESLKDSDSSVRKRALDLLFVMANSQNCITIIDELLVNLTAVEEDIEEMVFKIAIIAEKFSCDLEWYIDIMIQVILMAGDYVSEDVWFRIVQIVTNNQEIQDYACEKLLAAIKSKLAHETVICLAGYILGEFGINICDKPDMGGYEQYVALHQHYHRIGVRSKAILLTCYIKMMNLYPPLKDMITDVFHKNSVSQQLELQQRACEYLQLPYIDASIMETVLDVMPNFNKEVSNLERKMKENKHSNRLVTKAERADYDANILTHTSTHEPNKSGHGSASQPAKAPEVDLLSMDDDFSGMSTNSSNAGGAQSHDVDAKQLTKWYNTCILLHGNIQGQKGIMFENNLLKITTYPLFHQHQARVGLLITNNGNSEITQFKIDVEVTPSDCFTIQKQEPSSRMMPIEDTKCQLSMACMKPFVESPKLKVSFVNNNRSYAYTLQIPILATHFFEPIVLNKETYMSRWKLLEGSNKEVQEVFASCVTPLNESVISAIKKNVLPNLHIGIAEGMDGATTMTGCGTFRTGTLGPDGAPLVVGAMVRVEADVAGGRFRCTIRSAQGLVAKGLMNAIKSQLAAH